MNKHGFPGVRRRCSPQHHRKPFYARISIGCEQYRYSRNFATAEEAAAEYWRMKETRARTLSSHDRHTAQGE